eukprot:927677-Rhodomonas_salina.9
MDATPKTTPYVHAIGTFAVSIPVRSAPSMRSSSLCSLHQYPPVTHVLAYATDMLAYVSTYAAADCSPYLRASVSTSALADVMSFASSYLLPYAST